jgi:UDP-GlcNAc:undecaprenyl-phosphate GlcNAc-1-phosphate transferase
VIFVAAVLGVVAGGGLWLLGRSMWDEPALRRTNFRGAEVPVSVGILIPAATIVVEAGLRVAEAAGRHPAPGEMAGRSLALLAALGFGLLGTFDDLAAHGPERGFAGHLGSLARGRLTTGGLKLTVGGLLALVLSGSVVGSHLGRLLLGGAVIALAANLGNLFDRAPGRTTKVAVVAAVILAATASAGERPVLAGVVLVVAAGAGLLWFDLGEQLMLGDAGSNVLGAVLGLGLIMTTATVTQLVAVVVLAAANLASEWVSYGRVIDATPPLRALDRLGRRPPPAS